MPTFKSLPPGKSLIDVCTNCSFSLSIGPLTITPNRTNVVVELVDSSSTSVVLSCRIEGYPRPTGTFWLQIDTDGNQRVISDGTTTSVLFEGNTTSPVVLRDELTVELSVTGVSSYRWVFCTLLHMQVLCALVNFSQIVTLEICRYVCNCYCFAIGLFNSFIKVFFNFTEILMCGICA